MIKVYGSHMCRESRQLQENLDANDISYQFIDINENLRNLKRFLRMRDTLDIFDNCRESGDIGVPLLIPDDGEPTLKWQRWLQEQGYQVDGEAQQCCLLGDNE